MTTPSSLIRSAIFFGLAICSASAQTTTSFQEGVSPIGAYDMEATYIRSSQATTVLDTDPDLELIIGTAGSVLRGLLEFDLNAIPSGDVVDSVSLVMTTRTGDGGAGPTNTFHIYSYDFDVEEDTATWNEPSVGGADTVNGGTVGTLLTSATFDPVPQGTVVTFSDTAAFQTAVSDALAGDGFLRLMILKDNEGTSGNEFVRFAADSFGTAGFRPQLNVTHSTGGPDVIAPTLDLTDPVDNESAFFAGSNLVATFSEDIALKTGGTITFTDLTDGSGTFVITLPDAQASASVNEVTINPSSLLEFSTEYEVTIDGSAVEDLAVAPNAYAGTASGEWTFTTLAQDLTAPGVTTFSPADDAIDVSIVTDLEITFDEAVFLGSGNITLKNLTDSTDTVIDVTDGSQVSLIGTVMTVSPATALGVNKQYAVQIDAGIVVDQSSNPYPGIADNTTWNFDTETFPDPVAYWPMRDELPGTTFTGADDLIDNPDHDAKDATPDGGGTHAWAADPQRGIVYVTPETSRLDAGKQDIDMDKGFTWSLWVKTDGNQGADSGADVIFGSRSGVWNKLQTSGWNRWVDISGYNVDDGEWHHIAAVGSNSPSTLVSLYIDGNLVGSDSTLFNNLSIVNDSLEIGGSSTFGEDMAGSISDVAVWEAALPVNLITDLANDAAFFVDDVTAPILAATTPADDETSATALTLQAIFDELVTIGTGDIRIVNLTTPGTTTIAVTDASQVMVSGASMTIQPTVPLVAGETYAIEMDAGVVSNTSAGLPFAGILDQIIWNFTVDSTPPVVATTDPADDATNFGVLQDLVITFDEPVAVGTGDILFKDLTGATSETISITSSRVTISGNTVTINPLTDGIFGNQYAVQIDAGAITDITGNAYGGINDDTTWNFTAATPPGGGVLVDSSFETATFEEWTPASNAFLYDDQVEDPDQATGGFYSAELYSGGNITTTEKLNLDSFGYESVTIELAHTWQQASSTRRFEVRYSPDGVNFVWVARGQQSVGSPTTVTLTEGGGITSTNTQATNASGYSGQALTDNAKFQIYYSSNSSNHRVYIDDITLSGVSDATPPTLVSFVDNISGGPASVGSPLTYTVTFDEPMNPASIGTDDFENGSTAGITVDSVDATLDPSIYEVVVTPTSTGDLVLQVKAGASLLDSPLGNALNTASAIPDDTTITVEAGGASPYDTWADGFLPDDVSDPAGNFDSDTLSNLLEFAFGTNPTVSDAVSLNPDGSVNGLPIVQSSGSGGGITFDFLFMRRTDHATSGITYTAQFSNELGTWYDSTVPPTTVAPASAGYEVVSVPYPATLPNGKKARFARMQVDEVP